MPLHNPIPLCNLTYARETMSSATFNYDTTVQLMKNSPKLLYSCDNKMIDLEETRLIENNEIDIDKAGKVILIERKTTNIVVNHDDRMMECEFPFINKNSNKNLQGLMVDLNKDRQYDLSIKESDIDKINNYELNVEKSNLIKNKIFSLDLPSTLLIDNHKKVRDFYVYQKEIVQKINKILFPENYIKGIGKLNHLELYSLIIKGISYDSHFELSPMFYKYVDKMCLSKALLKDGLTMDKYKQPLCYDNENRLRNINHAIHNYLYRDNIDPMNKTKNPKLSYRYNMYKLNHDNNSTLLNRINLLNVNLSNSINLFHRITDRCIYKNTGYHFMYKWSIKNISRGPNIIGFYRDVIFNILNSNKNKYVYKVTNRKINKNLDAYPLDRIHQVKIIKSYAHSLFREYFYNIYKDKAIYLGDSKLFKIDKFKILDLSKISLTHIYMDETKLIGDIGERYIYAESSKLNLEVIKRWWWLNSTNPKDSLIIPNVDYAKMIDLLNNDDFEYLRYNNHPIEWGKDWGKDLTIPPKAISIEIMIDVINIITMVWHKNVQGWLCCTGRESIQLLMELLYDWYSMNSSKPNSDYYRVFRWVRWEAEKVYFLNTNSGLQAIGILVNNLITYMKNHHFNVVPIWVNPKAMDIERSFNHNPNNGDLIKELSKHKGKRHYIIKSQCLNKKRF